MPRSSSSHFIPSKGLSGKNCRPCHSFSNALQSGAFVHPCPSACNSILFPSDLHSSPGCRSDLPGGSETISAPAGPQPTSSRNGVHGWAWPQSPQWILIHIQEANSWSSCRSQDPYSPQMSLYTLMAPAALGNELVQSPLPAEAPRGSGLCFVNSLSPAPIIASGIQRVLVKLLNIFE